MKNSLYKPCQLPATEGVGLGVPFMHMMDVTGVEICLVCLSAMKEIRNLQVLSYQPQGHYPDESIRSSEGL